jgi:hypothetical protein
MLIDCCSNDRENERQRLGRRAVAFCSGSWDAPSVLNTLTRDNDSASYNMRAIAQGKHSSSNGDHPAANGAPERRRMRALTSVWPKQV